METLIYPILVAIVLILCFFVAKIALRWIVRLVLVVILFLIALGGAAWWWFDQSVKEPAKPRSTNSRRASSDRR
jgi:energy-coupling factor transporter transmembrane protein EcfT